MVIWVHNIYSACFVFSKFSFNILLVCAEAWKEMQVSEK